MAAKCVISMKPAKSSVWLEQKTEEQGPVLCAVRLLAAAFSGIHRCFFGCFQTTPKQTGTASLTGHKTCGSASSVTHNAGLNKMA